MEQMREQLTSEFVMRSDEMKEIFKQTIDSEVNNFLQKDLKKTIEYEIRGVINTAARSEIKKFIREKEDFITQEVKESMEVKFKATLKSSIYEVLADVGTSKEDY